MYQREDYEQYRGINFDAGDEETTNHNPIALRWWVMLGAVLVWLVCNVILTNTGFFLVTLALFLVALWFAAFGAKSGLIHLRGLLDAVIEHLE